MYLKMRRDRRARIEVEELNSVTNIIGQKFPLPRYSIIPEILVGVFIVLAGTLLGNLWFLLGGMVVLGLFLALAQAKQKYLILTLVIILINTVFRFPALDALPVFSVGEAGINIVDTLLFVSLLFLFLDTALGKKIPKDPLILAVGALLLYLIIPSLYTLLVAPQDSFWLIRELRGVVYYLVFFPFILALNSRRNLQIAINMLFLAVLASFSWYVLHIFGFLKMPGFEEQEIILGAYMPRILLINEFIPQTAFFLSFAIAAFSTRRRTRYIMYSCSMISVAYVFLTFTRSVIITTLFGVLILILLLSKGKSRSTGHTIRTLIKYTSHIILVLVASAVVLEFSVGFERVWAYLIARFSEAPVDDSILLRFGEWKGMLLDLFMENPIIGAGIGRTYKEVFLRMGLPAFVGASSSVIWLLAKAGIIGLLLYLWILFIFFRKSVYNMNIVKDNYLKAVSYGIFISALMLTFFGAVIGETVINPPAVILFCFFFAIVFSIGRLSKSTKEDKERMTGVKMI